MGSDYSFGASTESTYDLIGKAHHGDSRAVEQLFERLVPSLRRWARGRLPSWARGVVDTHDLVQDVALHTFSRLSALELCRQGSLQAYARQALLNRIRDEIRKVSRHPASASLSDDYPDDAPSPLEMAVGHEALDRYEHALAQLRPEYREAIIARVEFGFSYEEVAAALGKSTSNAARLLVRRALVGVAEHMSRDAPSSTSPPRAADASRTRRDDRMRTPQSESPHASPAPVPIPTVAALVADGTSVDWEVLEQSTTADVDTRSTYRDLRVVSTIGHVHRSAVPEPITTVSQHAALAPGERWGHLVLVRSLGHGGSSTVYLARDSWLDRDVALKLLQATRPQSIEAGLDEAWSLARVRDANVVAVHGAHVDRGRVGVWMEFVDGRTLESLIASEGPFPVPEALEIGRQLCRGLAAVHDAGILHRDVKAQNVMREPSGRVVLMDFGTSSLAARVASQAPRVAGTPVYLAPEVLAGGRPSVASDIYALGVTLFHLLTGRYPVEASTIDGLHRAHDAGRVIRLSDLAPRVPDEFIHVVDTALAVDPTDRYPNARAMEEALVHVGVRTSGSITSVTVPGSRLSVSAGDPAAFSVAARKGLGSRGWLLDLVVTRVIRLRARLVIDQLKQQIMDDDWSFPLTPFLSSTDIDPAMLVFLALHSSGLTRSIGVDVTSTPRGAIATLLNPLSLVDPGHLDTGENELICEIDVVGLPYPRDERRTT